MPPFRTRDADAPPAAPAPVRAAVAQMVRQFADAFAFYRELVQNSVDAGATAVDVRCIHDADRGVMRVVVADDGHGMDRATIEDCLLVLFRSSKSGADGKIGKYGVGFFAVFAVEPAWVEVDTGTGAEGWHVHLHPDCRFEITAAAPRRGTTVTLHVPLAAEAAPAFVARSLDALATWCAAVRTPLRFAATGVPGHDAAPRALNAPFALAAPGAMTFRDAHGAAYALAPEAGGVGAFYAHGLLLHRGPSPVPGVAFRVDAPDLSHTISRDGVRDDAAYRRVLAQLAALARGPLRAKLVAAFNAAAEAAARARHAGGADLRAQADLAALARAALEPGFDLTPRELTWPLVHPVARDGATAAALAWGGGWFGRAFTLADDGPNPVTAALAATADPVVDLGAAGEVFDAPLRRLFERLAGRLELASAAYCAPRVVPRGALRPAHAAALDATARALAPAGVRAVALAEPHGAESAALALAVPLELLAAPRDAALVPADALAGRALGPGLALNATHTAVRLALEAAALDPVVAGLALARLVRLAAGRGGDDDTAALLDAAREAAS